jgi:organic radical activating enzyme
MQAKRFSLASIITHWHEQGWLHRLMHGAHVILTGGEPLIQQAALTEFVNHLDRRLPMPPYLEIETNATFNISQVFAARLNQINASPKLLSSGESREKAYKPEVIYQLVALEKTIFKFVVGKPADIEEIIENYQRPFGILPARIWLMPEGGTLAAIDAKMPWLVDLAKQHLMHVSPRLHISIWGETTGV